MFPRKYLLGCLGKLGGEVGNGVTTRLSLYSHSFLFFPVSFNQSLVFPSRLKMLKSMPAHIGHYGPKQEADL